MSTSTGSPLLLFTLVFVVVVVIVAAFTAAAEAAAVVVAAVAVDFVVDLYFPVASLFQEGCRSFKDLEIPLLVGSVAVFIVDSVILPPLVKLRKTVSSLLTRAA